MLLNHDAVTNVPLRLDLELMLVGRFLLAVHRSPLRRRPESIRVLAEDCLSRKEQRTTHTLQCRGNAAPIQPVSSVAGPTGPSMSICGQTVTSTTRLCLKPNDEIAHLPGTENVM